jgi:tRNA-binding EMAP/Myf-like protein
MPIIALKITKIDSLNEIFKVYFLENKQGELIQIVSPDQSYNAEDIVAVALPGTKMPEFFSDGGVGYETIKAYNHYGITSHGLMLDKTDSPIGTNLNEKYGAKN